MKVCTKSTVSQWWQLLLCRLLAIAIKLLHVDPFVCTVCGLRLCVVYSLQYYAVNSSNKTAMLLFEPAKKGHRCFLFFDRFIDNILEGIFRRWWWRQHLVVSTAIRWCGDNFLCFIGNYEDEFKWQFKGHLRLANCQMAFSAKELLWRFWFNTSK